MLSDFSIGKSLLGDLFVVRITKGSTSIKEARENLGATGHVDTSLLLTYAVNTYSIRVEGSDGVQVLGWKCDVRCSLLVWY